MLIYFGIVACTAILGSNGQSPCLTPSEAQGLCISLTKCDSLLNLLKQTESLKAEDKETLAKSHCGFEGNTPKVCCPSNDTEVTSSTTSSPAAIPDPPDVTEHPNLRLINNEICGPVTETKIIQGNRTMVSEFPWMVLIGYQINGSNSPRFACGGTLITKRFVLTAAHCVTELGPSIKLSGVRIGEHDLSKEVDCDEEDGVGTVCVDKYQDFLIESVNPHADYSKKNHENDIALIRMNADADFGMNNVKPICLPVGNFAALKSKKVIVTGWGMTEERIRSQVLLKVKLEIASHENCTEIYRENHHVNVTYKQICAGGKDRRDSCAGDSGGPLQYPSNIKGVPKYVQYGIVNFGSQACGVVGYPGVYIKVVYFMDWILDNIAE